MTSHRGILLLLALLGAGCGHKQSPDPVPKPAQAGLGVDSLWSLAESAFNRGRYTKAQRGFEQVSARIGATDARYLRLHFFQGEILFAEGNQLQAVREFRRVADEQPDSPLAADALLRAGDAYADLWHRAELDPTYGETARGVYQEVTSRYDGTPAAARAVLRLNELSEKFAEKEYKSALFYYRFKAYDSAILMFRSVIASYPRSTIAPAALERLVLSYQKVGYVEDVKETCAYITQYHPDPAGPRRFCPVTPPVTPAAGGPAGPP